MAVLGAETLDSAQLAAMVPTPAPTAAPLLAPPTPGVPPPTPGLPPTTPGLVPPATPMPPTPLPMDVEMPQIPPDQVDLYLHCDYLLFLAGVMWVIDNIALMSSCYPIISFCTQSHLQVTSIFSPLTEVLSEALPPIYKFTAALVLTALQCLLYALFDISCTILVGVSGVFL